MQTYNQKNFFSFNRKFCYKDLTSGHKINLRDKRTKLTREIDMEQFFGINYCLLTYYCKMQQSTISIIFPVHCFLKNHLQLY